MEDAPRLPAPARLRVTAAAERSIRQGHPWVYSNSVLEVTQREESTYLGVIYTRENKFLALGYYDPDSPIRLRILQTGSPAKLDQIFWSKRLQEAVGRRTSLFNADTTGYRCIHGESEGWPGLVLDRYADTWVLKIYLPAWLHLLPMLKGLFKQTFPELKRLVVRFSRNVQEKARAAGYSDGTVLFGETPSAPVTFRENGMNFEADVLKGQKTGFFLDQRENRLAVSHLSAGLKVLNVFSFSGGFSLFAARGGAMSVASLDISRHALESARRNFSLNPGIAHVPHELIQADAFEWFQARSSTRYDLIVLDPPSLAKKREEKARALEAYERLVSASLNRLAKKGTLVAASCTAQVTSAEFFEVVLRGLRKSGRSFTELRQTFHPPDHPANFPEANYLKCIYLKESSPRQQQI
jgi:23S rRNA (cytosine1962-C5)-methyltransferase